jgi:nanoRNase/pAp phosphatase (c-di-AMP/oligoRNAs hydrolase)
MPNQDKEAPQSPAASADEPQDSEPPSPDGTTATEDRFDLAPALERLRGRESLLIYTHDNPDPDALAAALGLKRIIEYTTPMRATLALGGIVGRAENRAMVEAIGIPLVPVERLDPGRFDTLAVVDSQPGTGNNSLPTDRPVDIVIDHHPPREDQGTALWRDIRELGATSTIIVEYLRELRVPMDTALATALFYALRAETRDLGREATHAERGAYLFLFPLVDYHVLARITQPKVPREHFAAVDRALRSARVWGDVVSVNLGAIAYPDLVAEVADMLLTYDGAKFVLCCGRFGNRVFLSLRTEPSESRAGSLMRQLIDTEGAAGGHGTMAGARLYVPVTNDADQQVAFERLVRRLLDLTDRKDTSGTTLIPV